jgi:hypothetical protein
MVNICQSHFVFFHFSLSHLLSMTEARHSTGNIRMDSPSSHPLPEFAQTMPVDDNEKRKKEVKTRGRRSSTTTKEKTKGVISGIA